MSILAVRTNAGNLRLDSQPDDESATQYTDLFSPFTVCADAATLETADLFSYCPTAPLTLSPPPLCPSCGDMPGDGQPGVCSSCRPRFFISGRREARRAIDATEAEIERLKAHGGSVARVWADALTTTLDALSAASAEGHDAPSLADHVARYESWRELRRWQHERGYEVSGKAYRGGRRLTDEDGGRD